MSPFLALPLAVVTATGVLYLAATLFAIGLVGVSCRRNVLVMLLSVEILLNAANLAFVGFSRVHGDVTGQVFVFFAMTIAAAEVAVGLAIVIALFRLRRGADADLASDLRETGVGVVSPIVPEGKDAPHADHGHGGDAHGGGHDDGHGGGGHGHPPHGNAHGGDETPGSRDVPLPSSRGHVEAH